MSDARDIFISHVAEDSKIALEIAQGLEQAGYTTWYYERDCTPGKNYLIETGRAIEKAQAIVLIISETSIMKSRQVDAEVTRAHETGKYFLPILIGIDWPEFQQRQPLWRQAIGATVGISVPPEGVSTILPRMIRGLQALGILPETLPGAIGTKIIGIDLGTTYSAVSIWDEKRKMPIISSFADFTKLVRRNCQRIQGPD
jgi:hypothetical protein